MLKWKAIRRRIRRRRREEFLSKMVHQTKYGTSHNIWNSLRFTIFILNIFKCGEYLTNDKNK
jgi:hypothetical protein